ncbi:MAG: Lysine-tRNA ligase [candidate division TM6 bacterium GW2011_GWF2_43_17]|nr:MAG: Lysine-tRNA ligase [candidate division TM6 bacterium GW2011_GWF2_43_17]HAU30030.1 lysine--tRNA ligase [Candidatus Dependentiae bacterium]
MDEILGQGERAVRTAKVERLREQGIEPWPEAREISATCAYVHAEGSEDISYQLAGRVMTKREHGKSVFVHIQDGAGRLQLYIKSDIVGELQFKRFVEFIDLGDIIWVAGTLFVTKTGEKTIRVTDWVLESKSILPLPDKFHGIADHEIKHRQRYLDLITDPLARDRFYQRSRIVSFVRAYFEQHGYLEVETPILHPIPGGASARPFVTHHNALDTDFFLRIAPELYLKRLVVGGFERVFELNRNFRNEGVSTRHNPEFTMLECYTAHKDYNFIMDFVTNLLRELALQTTGSLQVPYGPHVINFDNIRRMSPRQAVVEFGGLKEEDLSPERIDATCEQLEAEVDADSSYNQKVFALFEACAENKIVDPVFIIDFPIEISPLAKRDANDAALAARFELFIAGMEIGNGFNELNDPFDQAERFKAQAQAHASGDPEAMRYDADFIRALEYGMPPTVGVGLGIDRIVMLMTNTTTIRDVILFPALRYKPE